MFLRTFSENYPYQLTVNEFVSLINSNKSVQLQTSGSTGKPNVLSYPATILKLSAQKTNSYFAFNVNTRALLCMSPDTIAGKMMLARALVGNYTIHCIAPSKRPLLNLKRDIDFIALVPLQLKESLLHDSKELKKIKTILVGGGPISSELEKLLVKNKVTVYHSFGMTETVSHIAIRKVGFEQEDYFHAIPGVEFSENYGQLVIHAPSLNIDSLLTNDIVELNSNFSFKWLGRKDFVINTGGYKIHPEILENKWADYLEIPFFLWKEPSEKWGEQMVMYIENEALPEINKTKLMSTFKSYELPKKYYALEKFLYTESGKINRPLTAQLKPKQVREETL